MAAINILLICYSRFAWLTYAFFFCLSAWSSILFFKTLRSGFRSGAIPLALVNAAAMCIYEGSFVFSGIEAFLLAIFLVTHWRECSKKFALIHYSIVAIPALWVMYRLIPLVGSGYANTHRGSSIATHFSWSKIPVTLFDAFSPTASITVFAIILVGFLLLGLCVLFKRSLLEAVMSASLVFLPALAMHMSGKGMFDGPDRFHRVAYALPLLFAFTGIGASYLLPRIVKVLVPLAGFSSAIYIFSVYNTALYSELSNITLWLNPAYYRQVADSLSTLVKPGSAVIFSDHLTRHRLDWYLSRHPENDIRKQTIPAGEGDITVSIVSGGDLPFGQQSGGEQEFWSAFASTEGVQLDRYTTFYSTVVRRSPVMAGDPPHLPIEFTFPGFNHFRHVYAQNKIFLSPYWGGALLPADTSGDCWFIYKIVFGQPKKRSVFGNIRYTNELNGNIVEVALSPDGVHFQSAHYGVKVGTGIIERFNLLMPDSARELFVRVKLKAQRWPPDPYLDNASLLRIENIKLYVGEQDDAARCDILNTVSSSPVDTKAVPLLQPAQASHENLAEVPTQEIPGWQCFGVADEAHPGTVRVTVAKQGTLALYPRVGKQADTVKVVNADTGQQLLFLAGVEGKWTPLGMRYDLPLNDVPEGRVLHLDIKITGRAQLWVKDDAIILNPAPGAHHGGGAK